MSQNKRNNGRKGKTRCDVGIEHICGFLRFIGVAAGAFFLIAVLGMWLFPKSPASKIAYQLTIIFCGITAIGGWFACKVLEKKDKELKERETILKNKDK